MNYWKDKLMEQQEAYTDACSFLCEVGCLEECEYHEGVYFEGNEEIESAYRIANSKITKGEIVLARGETRRQYTDRLKAAYDENSAVAECCICEKNLRDD